MAVMQVSAKQVVSGSRAALGLNSEGEPAIDDIFLAASLRRAAGILCPCPPASLGGVVVQSLQALVPDVEDLRARVNDMIEMLITEGDLLELGSASTDDENARSTWLFAAPPSFVVRPDHTIAVVGITSDEASPLPSSLNARIVFDAASRTLRPAASEPLAAVLRELGLLELPLSVWLKTPRSEPAGQFLDGMRKRLSRQAPSGEIAEVGILDCQRSDYYAGRWTVPSKQTGEYVARRPQAFGAPVWGFAALTDGRVKKFLEFPLKRTTNRGCDVAWHLQMAIDHLRGMPQSYRRRTTPQGIYLDFFSPLPQWAVRRLSMFGRAAPPEHCLLSFRMPDANLGSEEDFLQERLWLVRRP